MSAWPLRVPWVLRPRGKRHDDLVINTGDEAWEFYTDLLVVAARTRATSPRRNPCNASATSA